MMKHMLFALLFAQVIITGGSRKIFTPSGTIIGNTVADPVAAGYATTSISPGYAVCVGPYTTSALETLIKSQWWLNVLSGTLNAQAAVYSISGTTGTFISNTTSASITGYGNRTFTFSSGSVPTSTSIVICIATDGSTTTDFYYLTPGSTGSSFYYQTSSSWTFPSWPLTLTFGNSPSYDIGGNVTVHP